MLILIVLIMISSYYLIKEAIKNGINESVLGNSIKHNNESNKDKL